MSKLEWCINGETTSIADAGLGIRATFPELPFIAISGADREEICARLQHNGLLDAVWGVSVGVTKLSLAA